jgi:hypothetical protein
VTVGCIFRRAHATRATAAPHPVHIQPCPAGDVACRIDWGDEVAIAMQSSALSSGSSGDAVVTLGVGEIKLRPRLRWRAEWVRRMEQLKVKITAAGMLELVQEYVHGDDSVVIISPQQVPASVEMLQEAAVDAGEGVAEA